MTWRTIRPCWTSRNTYVSVGCNCSALLALPAAPLTRLLAACADGGSDYIPRVIKDLANDPSVLTLVCNLPEAEAEQGLSGLGEHQGLPSASCPQPQGPC